MTLLWIALAAYAALAWKDLRTAFFLFIAFLPAYVIRLNVSGLPTTALELLFAILFIAWMLKREKRLIDIKGWGWLLLAWLAVATLSMFVSPDFRAAAGVWKAYFVEPVLFFLLANDLLRTQADRLNAVKALAWSAIAVGASAVVQHWTNWGVPPPFDGHPIPPATEAEFRSTSFYGFPNAIGLFLAPLVPIFTATAIMHPPKRKENLLPFWLFASAALLSLAGILFAQSEGAIVGVAAGIAFLALASKKTRLPALLAGSLLGIVLLAVPVTRATLIEKLTLSDWSGRVRTQMWGETWNMLKDHAIFGAGLSGYPIVFDKYLLARYIEIFQYPLDLLLDFWTETGLAGVIVFALLIWRYTASLRAACRRDPATCAWVTALAAAMIALLVHGLVDVPYFKNDLSMLFWLLCALASSMAAEKKMTGMTGHSHPEAAVTRSVPH